MIFVKDLIESDKRKVYLLRSFFNLHWVYEKDKRWVWVLFILPWIYFPNFKSDCILGICIKKGWVYKMRDKCFHIAWIYDAVYSNEKIFVSGFMYRAILLQVSISERENQNKCIRKTCIKDYGLFSDLL